MTPGPGGTLYVWIPRPGGSLLALLDDNGRPHPGWPIVMEHGCWIVDAADDGSVRLLCSVDRPESENDAGATLAFAFDADGSLMSGWPVEVRAPQTAVVIGTVLTLVSVQSLTESTTGQFSHEAWMTTIAADGGLRVGTRTPVIWPCCAAIGPDGVAAHVAPEGVWDYGYPEVSRVTVLDLNGAGPGWPVTFEGIASGPAFGLGGRIVLTVGSFVRSGSRVLAFEGGGYAVAAVSAELAIDTAESGADCVAGSPHPPLVARDGTIFVFSEIDPPVYALDPSLTVTKGWPFEPATPLERPNPWEETDGINCASLAVPAIGPDATLYLPLQARDATVGGSIVAVGPDGRVRRGWPVELRRPGAEFWSIVVGSDGTAYALALEPEVGDGSSATIVAIAPDSTVRYTTTLVDPEP